jgi:hypothetical protein
MANRGISSGIRSQAERMLKTGKRWDKFDQIRERHFWSCHFFRPDQSGNIQAGRYTLFTTPVGSNGQGFPSGEVITERESNWKSQNRVPDNQNFEIKELGCAYMPCGFDVAAFPPLPPVPPETDPDVLAAPPQLVPPSPMALLHFFQSTILSITYLTNSVPLGNLADFAQSSAPVMGLTYPNSSRMSSVVSNGFAAPALRRSFKIPVLLQAGESFNFTLEVPRPIYMASNLPLATTNGVFPPPFLIRMDFWARESFVEKS